MIIINGSDRTILMTSKIDYNNNNNNLIFIKTDNINLYSIKYNMNYIYFTNYSKFIQDFNNQETYGFFVTNIRFQQGVDKTDIIFLGNHGYNKNFDLFFTFDSLLFNRLEIEKNFKVAIPIIFLSDVVAIALAVYSFTNNSANDSDKFIILFENHFYSTDLIQMIYRNKSLEYNIKKYFENYKNLINFFKNKEEARFYAIKYNYPLEHIEENTYKKNTTEKEENTNSIILRYNRDLESFFSKSPISHKIRGLPSYFKYLCAITRQRIFSVFITPKELVHKISGLAKKFKKSASLSDVILGIIPFVLECKKIFLLETRNALLVVDKNIYENEEQKINIDTLDAKQIFNFVFMKIAKLFLEVNVEHKPILDKIEDYIAEDNWIHLSYLENKIYQNDITKIFAFHLAKPINLVMYNHQFSTLFLQFILEYKSVQGYEKIPYCFVASSSKINKLSIGFLPLLMEPNDIKNINKFIIKNIQVENVSFYHTMYFITDPLYIEIVGMFHVVKDTMVVYKNDRKYCIFTFSCISEVKKTKIEQDQYIIDMRDFQEDKEFTILVKNSNGYKREDVEHIFNPINVIGKGYGWLNFKINFEVLFTLDRKQTDLLIKNKEITIRKISGFFNVNILLKDELKGDFHLTGVLDKHLVEFT
ncbi:MAG: hypothetical protein QW255_04790 [Candidatus Bilamarchaeaceae archaeon]